MEQQKQAFLARYKEIEAAYLGLEEKQREIQDQLQNLRKEASKKVNFDSKKLLSGMKGESKIESQISGLNKELRSIRETLSEVRANGGLDAICKTDEDLEKLAAPLMDALKKEAKEDEKKRKSLEKRYEKLIEDVLQLEEERESFIREGDKKENILRLIHNSTDLEVDFSEIASKYRFEKAGAYAHLGRVKNFE